MNISPLLSLIIWSEKNKTDPIELLKEGSDERHGIEWKKNRAGAFKTMATPIRECHYARFCVS